MWCFSVIVSSVAIRRRTNLSTRGLKNLRLISKNCEFAEEYNIIQDKIEFSVFD